MDVLRAKISRQRVKHIVSSYDLNGAEIEKFLPYLDDLLKSYPMPAVELALVEVLVEHWGKPSLVRGCPFLDQVSVLLKQWKEEASVAVHVTPEQFHYITGLDPRPVFGPSEHPSSSSVEPVSQASSD